MIRNAKPNPPSHELIRPSEAAHVNNNVETIITGQSILIELRDTTRGYIMAVTPSIKAILAIFDPTTLPIAISGFPLKAACILTRSSGAEVPKATIVIPITSGEILNLEAIDTAPLTR